jgi:hypothetical protein
MFLIRMKHSIIVIVIHISRHYSKMSVAEDKSSQGMVNGVNSAKQFNG